MAETYENDNRMFDPSKVAKASRSKEPITEEQVRAKARELKNTILIRKNAAS